MTINLFQHLIYKIDELVRYFSLLKDNDLHFF